ncbi:response regulator [Mongoliimonas terrestris]|uniref:response regulator n=1 Tax=Mongoliimonas terrestris TaxID=1709001 RepID=UPI00094981FD|nr:response regulator [Mongoliimonas terrestris]
MTATAPPVIVLLADGGQSGALLRQTIRTAGFTALEYVTDETVLEIRLARSRVDLLVIDHAAGQRPPWRTVANLRADDRIVNRIMPILMVTAEADQPFLREAVATGVDEVIEKPVSAAAISQRIRAMLDHPRVYIRTRSGYFGPDRRRTTGAAYHGPERRIADDKMVVTPWAHDMMRQQTLQRYGGALPGSRPAAPPSRARPAVATQTTRIAASAFPDRHIDTLPPVLVGPVTVIPADSIPTNRRLNAVVVTPRRPAPMAPVAAETRPPPPRPAVSPPPVIPAPDDDEDVLFLD